MVWLLDGQGALSVGSADELIAAGYFSRAFDTVTLRFSAERGQFELMT